MEPVAEKTNLVANASFEESSSAGAESPPGWHWGATAEAGTWAIDDQVSSEEGGRSLRLEPAHQGVAVHQFLLTSTPERPTIDLAGKTVTLEVDIRREGMVTPVAQVIAFNPDLPTHPLVGTGAAGVAQVVGIHGPADRFRTYRGKFVASGDVTLLQISLVAAGSGGRVWFDRVAVEITP